MKTIIKATKRYLYDALGVRVQIHPWKNQNEVPFFLLDSYEFYQVVLLEKPCLLMLAKEGQEATPAKVRKHWEQLQKRSTSLCIFVQKTISAYNRKRLIEHRVPFIVPGNQMYLIELGIDFRERFHKPKTRKSSFSPATQAVVIYSLLHKTDGKLTPSKLASKLNYTLMTMTRAFDELETAGIGEFHRKGRERWWLFKGSQRDLWKQVEPLMRNPVKKRTWVMSKKPKVQSGLSALALFSMLSPPTTSCYAISIKEWKNWKESGVKELPEPEEDATELEIWHYDPNLFVIEGSVDPFSLYLSLKENKDERIESALEEIMEAIKW